MRAVIERVTCDWCGQTFDFEKYSEATHTSRNEKLSDWLLQNKWSMSNGAIMGDFCPTCSAKRKNGSRIR